jgi:LysM domain
MADFIGRDGFLAVFSNATDAVIIDTNLNLVVGLGKSEAVLSSRDWEPTNENFSDSTVELATGALTTLDIKVITASGRMYTIPAGVVSEAKKSLEWHKQHHRGGTPVGLNTARTLARGGQIGIEKVRHIAKYFPRHEVDKKGKGWEPGEDGFPSNGRIAWALWGGDSAWRWAKAIVERENKKATTASGYTVLGYDADPEIYSTPEKYEANLDAFKDAFELEEGAAPEFMARVRLDGSGMDRLYKLDTDGQVYVWDDMGWDSLGHVDGDVWTYDKALDDPYDSCEKDHVIIDPESAMIMSALLQSDPYSPISIDDVDPEGAEIFEDAAPEEDWDFVKGITAAMAPAPAQQQKGPSGSVAHDSVYSPKERSLHAKSQTRDAGGMFVAKGSRVVVGGDGENGRGQVTGLNPATGATTVALDNGKTIEVPAKLTQKEDKFTQPNAAPAAMPTAQELAQPLDVSGVLGEPRSPINQPAAQLPGTLPPMDQGALQNVLQNWGGYVESQRAAFKPITDQEARTYAKQTGQRIIPSPAKVDPNKTTDAGQRAANQVAVPGDNGNIAVQDAPMMAGRADFKPGGDSGDSGKDKLREQLQGIKDRTTYHNRLFTPSEKPAAPSGSTNVPVPNAKPGTRETSGNGGRSGIDWNGIGKKPDTTPTPKAQPGAWDTGKNGTGRNGVQPADPRNAPGSNRDASSVQKGDSRNAPGSNRETKPTQSQYDSKGRYIVQKGDSLWTIAGKTTPKGMTQAQHWRDIMQSNPHMKSGDPNKIFSGERVWIPGANGSSLPKSGGSTGAPSRPIQKGDSRNAPGSNRSTSIQKGDSRNAPGSNRNGVADSRNAPGSNRETKIQQADSRNAPGSNRNGVADSRNAPGSNASPRPIQKGDSRNAPGSNRNGIADSRNAPGSNASPKQTAQPGAWDTGKNGTGRTGPAKPGSMYDSQGRYVVQKGDSLWSIADKTKPEGTSTAKHWTAIMNANKGKLKSGNPSLIYSGERVHMPAKPADSRNAPGSNKSGPVQRGDSRNAPGSNASPKPPAKADSRNAPGTTVPRPKSSDSRNAPGSNASPKPAAPKATASPGAWDTGKKGTGKPASTASEPKYKPVGDNKIAAHAKAGLDAIQKPRGSAGARKRNTK